MDRGPDPDPDVLSGPGPVTDKISGIVKFCKSVSILKGTASPAVRVKVEQPSETHRPLCIANLMSQSNPCIQTCRETRLSVR